MSRVALTYRDYAALPDDGRRYQVLDGELDVAPAPGTRHQAISMNLSALVHAHVTRRLGRVLAAPTDVILKDAPVEASIVQPDLLFVSEDTVCPSTDRRRRGASGRDVPLGARRIRAARARDRRHDCRR